MSISVSQECVADRVLAKSPGESFTLDCPALLAEPLFLFEAMAKLFGRWARGAMCVAG